MIYQLVLQFPGSSHIDFEKMIAVEEALVEALAGSADVDGHDLGSGEFNIFTWTQDPAGTLAAVTRMPSIQPFLDRLRVAYRSEDGEAFTPIYPDGLAHFSVT